MKTKGDRHISVVISERARSNGHKTHGILNIRKYFFAVRVADSGCRLPKEVVASPSLEVLRT